MNGAAGSPRTGWRRRSEGRGSPRSVVRGWECPAPRTSGPRPKGERQPGKEGGECITLCGGRSEFLGGYLPPGYISSAFFSQSEPNRC